MPRSPAIGLRVHAPRVTPCASDRSPGSTRRTSTAGPGCTSSTSSRAPLLPADRRRRALLRRPARPDATGHAVPAGLAGGQRRAAGRSASTWRWPPRSAGVDLVHSHTWYANLAGHLAKLLHGIPHVVTAHSLEPRRPWKAEQLGGGYRLSSWAERTAYEARRRGHRGQRRHARRRARRLPRARPGPGARGPQRHRHRRVPPGPRHRRRRAARRRPRPAVRAVRRPDHPAEGADAPARRRRAAARRSPAGAAAPAPPDTPEIAAEIADAVAELQASRARASSGSRQMLPRASSSSSCSPRATVFVVPVGVRAAGHRQPRGDGLRDRGGRQRRRRHPRGGRRRRDRAAGALRRRPTRPTFAAGLAAADRPSCSPTPRGPRRWARPGASGLLAEFGWAAIAQQTVEVYETVLAARRADRESAGHPPEPGGTRPPTFGLRRPVTDV